MEWLLTFAIIYFGIFVPFKYWQVSGQYDYLKKDTDAKIAQLEYDRQYYIDQIKDYQIQIGNLSRMNTSFQGLWDEAYNKLEQIENVLLDEDSSNLFDKISEILWADDEEDNDESIWYNWGNNSHYRGKYRVPLYKKEITVKKQFFVFAVILGITAYLGYSALKGFSQLELDDMFMWDDADVD